MQKGIGDSYEGCIRRTAARRILNTGQNETKKETALKMLRDRELPIEKIAEYSGLKVEEVKQLAKIQPMEK